MRHTCVHPSTTIITEWCSKEAAAGHMRLRRFRQSFGKIHPSGVPGALKTQPRHTDALNDGVFYRVYLQCAFSFPPPHTVRRPY